jgi:hypothetical protein
MKIYVIRTKNDYDVSDVLVTTNQEKAYEVAFKQAADNNELEIWEDDKLISSYIREAWFNATGHVVYGKWEHNYGQRNEFLEA